MQFLAPRMCGYQVISRHVQVRLHSIGSPGWESKIPCCAGGLASSLLDGSKGGDLADFIEHDTPEPSKPEASKPAARMPSSGAQASERRRPPAQGAVQPGSTPAGAPSLFD